MKAFLMAVITFLVLCASSVKGEGPILSAGEYYLSASEATSLKKRAFAGDISATNRLSDYYSIYEGDRVAGEFWLRVAAEFDDCAALTELVYRYSSMRKIDEKQLFYWRMRKSGLQCTDDQ